MPSRFRRVFSSSVGTKLLMGLTGVALFLYMLLHLAGNALIFAGPEIFNEYSHKLISNPLIIPIEIGLLAVFLVHIYKAVDDVDGESVGTPGGLQQEGTGRRREPQERGFLDHDRPAGSSCWSLSSST